MGFVELLCVLLRNPIFKCAHPFLQRQHLNAGARILVVKVRHDTSRTNKPLTVHHKHPVRCAKRIVRPRVFHNRLVQHSKALLIWIVAVSGSLNKTNYAWICLIMIVS